MCAILPPLRNLPSGINAFPFFRSQEDNASMPILLRFLLSTSGKRLESSYSSMYAFLNTEESPPYMAESHLKLEFLSITGLRVPVSTKGSS
jgi:hypothetical protein